MLTAVCRSQLRACVRIGCRPLLDLPQLCVLPFDLCRPCLLPPLEALDAVHHGGTVCVDGAEQAGEQELEGLVTLVRGLRRGELCDGGGGLLERHATADEDGNELPRFLVVVPLGQVVDGGAIPHLNRGQRRYFSLDARPIRVGGIRRMGGRHDARGHARGEEANGCVRMSHVVLLGLDQNGATTTPHG